MKGFPLRKKIKISAPSQKVSLRRGLLLGGKSFKQAILALARPAGTMTPAGARGSWALRGGPSRHLPPSAADLRREACVKGSAGTGGGTRRHNDKRIGLDKAGTQLTLGSAFARRASAHMERLPRLKTLLWKPGSRKWSQRGAWVWFGYFNANANLKRLTLEEVKDQQKPLVRTWLYTTYKPVWEFLFPTTIETNRKTRSSTQCFRNGSVSPVQTHIFKIAHL